MVRITLFCITLLIAGSASTAAIINYRTPTRPEVPNPKAAASAQGVVQMTSRAIDPFENAQEGEFGKALWLTVKPTGFEPAQVTLAANQYFLLVQNATGLDQLGLVVQREQGERLREVRLENRNRKWKQVINFTPGRYIISDTDHPEWQCVLTITEK